MLAPISAGIITRLMMKVLVPIAARYSRAAITSVLRMVLLRPRRIHRGSNVVLVESTGGRFGVGNANEDVLQGGVGQLEVADLAARQKRRKQPAGIRTR